MLGGPIEQNVALQTHLVFGVWRKVRIPTTFCFQRPDVFILSSVKIDYPFSVAKYSHRAGFTEQWQFLLYNL